jgi:hypothetical protein
LVYFTSRDFCVKKENSAAFVLPAKLDLKFRKNVRLSDFYDPGDDYCYYSSASGKENRL